MDCCTGEVTNRAFGTWSLAGVIDSIIAKLQQVAVTLLDSQTMRGIYRSVALVDSVVVNLQQEAVALLESQTSEDSVSEEGIAALHSKEEEQDTQQGEEEGPEEAARALLGLPDMQTGVQQHSLGQHSMAMLHSNSSPVRKASAPLSAVAEEEDDGSLPEANTRFQAGHRAFRRSASSQGPRVAKKGNSFSHDAQAARFHPHGWSRHSTHGEQP